MRKDLDRLMQEREIDALIILNGEEDTYRDYLLGGRIHANAIVIKKQGADPQLIVNGMEVDEARKSGLPVFTYNDVGMYQIMQEHKDPATREIAIWQRILEQFEVSGRVAFYGHGDVMTIWKRLRRFEEHLSDRITLVEDEDQSIFSLARATKDPDEIAMMTEIGAATSAVMRQTRAWLATHQVNGETLVKADGSPLTIGDVKIFIKKALLEHNLTDSGRIIFAQGADAGVPHSLGEPDEALQLGKTIIFDLFPKNPDKGYYHDLTRTWCLGYAPDEVQAAHELVLHAFHQSLEAIGPGEQTANAQKLVCEIFEAQGHPTPLNTPGTDEGYVHSLGHGLGLDVHEAPGMSTLGPEQTFEVGHVITVEPGLYYPSRGWGIRIEDTLYIDTDGQLVNISDVPYDLVIELDG